MVKNTKKSNMRNYIILGSILLVCIIFIIVFSLVPNKKKDDDSSKDDGKIKFSRQVVKSSQVKTITNSSLNKEQCVGKVCVSKLEVNAYPNKGYITYVIKNKGTKEADGGIKMIFNDDYVMYATYHLKAGESDEGYMNYSDHDLNEIKSYKLEKMTDRDFAVFVN
ncbi:MAG: hypothetical protein IJG68_08045 [Bacilli bacterium]|nr:hypothetical protein [Bacilli bacterium]